MNAPFYTRTRIHQTRTRHELGLTAQEIREALHFARLPKKIELSEAEDLIREIGQKLDDFAAALTAECGEDHRPIEGAEFFYDAADKLAIYFAERRQEHRIAEESDEATDRGCHQYHQGRGV